MQKILLVRPGMTDYDQQGRIQGTLDIPMCEDGRRQCEATLREVAAAGPAVVYASPCESAREAAEQLADRAGVKSKTLDKLRNLDHGLWQGMLIDDVRTKQPKVYRQWQEQPETVCPPSGETVLAAKARVAESLSKLLKKHKEDQEPIALVAPEPLASLIRHVLRQDGLSNLWKSNESCGAWEVIDVPQEMAAGAV